MTRILVLLGILALILVLVLAVSASAWSPEAPSLPPDRAQVRAALQGAPLLFIQNAGQFDPAARFQVRGGLGGGSVWLAEEALWVTLVRRPSSPRPPSPTRGEGGEAHLPSPFDGRGAGGEGVHLKLRFLGASPQPRLEPFNRLETHVSYFLGNDPAQWRADVPVWGGVRYVGLYPGMDLALSGEGGRWAWRLLAGPGAELGQVRLGVEGAEEVAVEGGRVRLDTALGVFSLPPLLSAEGAPLQPSLADGVLAFAPQPAQPFPSFPESVDSPPVGRPADDLLYSTFLGGSSDDGGYAIVLDGAGAAYVTGSTWSTDFPTTPGAFDPSHNGGSDAFVTRLGMGAATPTPTPTRTPGVALVKINVPYGTVQPGERISYTIHYSNVGGVPLSGIVITDAIPLNTVLDPASLQPPATVQAGVIRWQPLPTVLPGGSERVAFAVALPTPTPGLRPGVVGEGAAPPAPVGAQAPLQGCPPGVQVCNVAWIYTTQTNRWQASNPAFNPSTRLYLPLVLKGP